MINFRKTWIYRLWSAFLTWFGDIRIDFDEPETAAKHLRRLLKCAQPGDVICRRYDSYLDGVFIPGKYTHSGLVVSSDTVIHSIAEGVCQIDILDFVLNTDGFIVLRPTQSHYDVESSIKWAHDHIGDKYNFWFWKETPGYFYCHEFVAYALGVGGITIPHKGMIYADNLISTLSTVYQTDNDPVAMQMVYAASNNRHIVVNL